MPLRRPVCAVETDYPGFVLGKIRSGVSGITAVATNRYNLAASPYSSSSSFASSISASKPLTASSSLVAM